MRLRDFDAHRWLAPGALAELPQATLTRKALTLALCSANSARRRAEGERSSPRRAQLANLQRHMSSRFGQLFQIATFGESHGGGVGVVVDGCPPRLAITAEEIQRDLDRRRPGQSRLTTPRDEPDRVEILSGVFEGRTLGTPIALLVRNQDARPEAYAAMKDVYRPSHADYTTEAKYGIRNWQGGGRASARETVGRVAAGAIARKLLAVAAGVEVLAWVRRVHEIEAKVDAASVTLAAVEANPVRCPDPSAAAEMAERIDAARRRGDSLGGVVECVARGVPAGLGEPVFDKLEADLARALMSLPASKGFEIGSGFAGHPHDRDRSTTIPSCPARTAARAPPRTAPAACRAASATASRSSCASPSSRPRRSRNRSRPSTAAAPPPSSKRRAATIPACCRARCRWSRRWSAWCSPTTGCASAASTCFRR